MPADSDIKLSSNQLIEVNSFLENKSHIERRSIRRFLKKVKYPLYFMDFETTYPAVPEFDNSRPYQQIPFQYSLHCMESKNGEPKHFEFLPENPSADPRPEFIRRLLTDTQRPGSILVFNQKFEITRLKEIARDFPEFAEEINERILRCIDLMEPFKNKHYYKPEMRGSYSLKVILPTIAPELSYDNLQISGGDAAGNEFLRLREETDPTEIQKIRTSLLEYCKQDTYGLIVILKELERESSFTARLVGWIRSAARA
jgi:hypothetical protein